MGEGYEGNCKEVRAGEAMRDDWLRKEGKHIGEG